ncbi:MAG: hypothetical protein IJ437_05550 [Clostridia bacterium]|nr:hypothetical protein [Clostridia bacterium]
MIGKCFGILCIISVIFAIFTGNLQGLNDGILEGASKSVTTVISLIGIMTFWNGVMQVLMDAGIINKLSKLLKPILKFVFPRAFKENKGANEITACISANILGLSNASTPLALNAIEKLNEDRDSDKATNDMITLAVLGCACFSLIPTTVIAIRIAQGASITYEIIIPVWVVSGICMLLGIILSRIIGKISGDC